MDLDDNDNCIFDPPPTLFSLRALHVQAMGGSKGMSKRH